MGGGLQGAAAVLVVDYGTGIRIAAPTTVLSAMTKAIRNGILIKGGRALENLAEVDAVVFDKTGTLTTGHPDVLEVVPVNSSTVDEVLALAAAAERRLTHPVADAIVRAAEARQVTIPERTTSDYSLVINGKVNGKNLASDGHSRAVHVDETKVISSSVPISKTSALWIPLNGSERDALSTSDSSPDTAPGKWGSSCCIGCDC